MGCVFLRGSYTRGQSAILLVGAVLGLMAFLPSADAADPPIAHWRFDEGTGTSVYDEGPRTVTGTFMTPNPTWSTDVPPVSFTNPYSLSFTSTGDGVQFAWPSALNFTGTEERSFAFWYKPTANGEVASGNFDRIMSWSGDAFEIAGTYGNVAVHRLAFYDGTWRDTGFDLTVGTWYNITFTYDGTNVKLYVAGDEKFSGTSGGRDINGTLYIGVRHTGDEGINGRIDDVRVYDYALTQDQVQNLVDGSDDPGSAPRPTLSGALLPADNATGVSPGTNLVITFNRAVVTGTGTITIKKTSDNSTVETIPATDGRVTGSGSATITINPTATLAESTAYYVQVHPNAFKTAAGGWYAGISDATSWNFTTGDFTAPSATAFSPADDATGVDVDTALQITFGEAARAGTGTLAIRKASDASLVETITVSGAALTGNGTTQLTLDPSVSLDRGTEYYVTWTANAFKDAAGNHTSALASATTWSFTTLPASSSSSSSSSSSDRPSGGGRRGSPGRGGVAPPRFGADQVQSASSSSAAQAESLSEPAADEARWVAFRDVSMDDWYGTYVKRLVELEIFEGYKDTEGNPLRLYGPQDSITMGQLAKVATVLARVAVEPVHGDGWETPYVDAARAMGLTPFSMPFAHDAPAPRADVLRAVLEALGVPTRSGLPAGYADVPAGSPHYDVIMTATMLGIVDGDDGADTFRPEDPVTRAEVAKMVVNALLHADTEW